MPAEANESLVRVFLESNDYLVTVNKKIRMKQRVKTKNGIQTHHTPYELDIVAINPKSKIIIIGEVKGWRSGLSKGDFKDIKKPTNDVERANQKSLKIVNDKKYIRKLKKKVEEIYGFKNFKIVLFVDHINKKDRDLILTFARKKKFEIRTFGDILDYLDDNTFKFSYANEPITQLLRIQERYKKRKQKIDKKKSP